METDGSPDHDEDISSAQSHNEDYDGIQEPHHREEFLEEYFRKFSMGGPQPQQFGFQYHVSYITKFIPVSEKDCCYKCTLILISPYFIG